MSDASGHLVVCPTPIGNLEDVTLRVLSALRDADVIACEDTRRTRMLLDRYGVGARSSPTTSTTRQRARASWSSACGAGRPSRSSPTPACRSCPIRATCSCAPASRRGSRSRCCRAVGGARRAGGLGVAVRPLALRGFLPRKKELRELLAEPGGTLVAFESPKRLPATLAVLAEIDPRREPSRCAAS